MNTLLVIAGPTGVGKTKLAIDLALQLNTIILSSDSRQFYKELSIGTAKPTSKELNTIKHYFINSLSIHQTYSAGKYEIEAVELLKKLFKQHKIIILTGGSGLYIDAICNGFNADLPKSDSIIRGQLNQLYNTYGLSLLQEKLKQLDPKAYKIIDTQNAKRLFRAIEIAVKKNTSFTYSSSKHKPRAFRTIKLVVHKPTHILYEDINKRVDSMISNGLLEEARSMYTYKHLNALNTVGYKELFPYFDGDISKQEAIENIKINTRRYAKRQLSWFRRDKSYLWFDISNSNTSVKDYILSQLTTA